MTFIISTVPLKHVKKLFIIIIIPVYLLFISYNSLKKIKELLFELGRENKKCFI